MWQGLLKLTRNPAESSSFHLKRYLSKERLTMSNNDPPDPFTQFGGSGFNPYSSPQLYDTRKEGLTPLEQVKAKVRTPAILLAVVGALGMVGSIFVGILVGALNA